MAKERTYRKEKKEARGEKWREAMVVDPAKFSSHLCNVQQPENWSVGHASTLQFLLLYKTSPSGLCQPLAKLMLAG